MSSIDIIFDRTAVYRLHSKYKATHNLFARMTTKPYIYNDPHNHPIHGRNNVRRVYHAILEAYNSPLRGTPLPPIEVAVKWVQGKQAVENLSMEASFYQCELRNLQGKVVPRYYGFYSENIEGTEVGCLVLEWCNGPVTYPPDELCRRRILAACKLHDAGVEHGRLYDRDGRHFVIGPDGSVRIIDFSVARPHKCCGAVPQLLIERPGEIPAGCEELEDLEARIGSWTPPPETRPL